MKQRPTYSHSSSASTFYTDSMNNNRRRKKSIKIPQTPGKSRPGQKQSPEPTSYLALPPKLHDNVYFPSLDDNDYDNNNNNDSKISANRVISTGSSDTYLNSNTQDNTNVGKEPMNKGYNFQERNRNDPDKKIYSVYPNDGNDTNENMSGDFEDLYNKVKSPETILDAVGDIVADVVEGKYWNNTSIDSVNDDKMYDYNQTKREYRSNTMDNKTSAQQQSDGEHPTNSHRRRKRYWRDRLAERVDYALGVHEDGKYYRSWEEQVDREKNNRTGGNDAVSIFYGKQRKDLSTKIKKHVNFWEEDGSLMSLFFGRTPNGKRLSFTAGSSVNICTTIFKLTFQYSIAFFSQLCRWASCRGSLPQPIVVFFLAASALSAPRRRRLVTVGITLIALRTLAEALHGYVNYDEGWEDD